MLVPPAPESWYCPYWLDPDVSLMTRLVAALGIVTQSGAEGEFYVLPDGARFPKAEFRPHQDIVQVAHLWHLVRTKGIFITYGPEPDSSSAKWLVKDDLDMERETDFRHAPQTIVEAILARLEHQPPAPIEEPAPVIVSFTATPPLLDDVNTVAELSWEAVGVASLHLDNGIGDVTGATKYLVTPTATTTYSLTGTNTTGAVMSTVIVEVTPKVEPTPPDTTTV